MSTVFSRRKALVSVVGGLAAAVAAACTAGASSPAASSQTERKTRMWDQLTSLFEPVTLRSMTDHRAYMLPSGYLLALHFDNTDLSKAENLNWVALGVPGKFTRADQQRVEQTYGKGFTHFHDLANDSHGGAPGVGGVWFMHIAVRDFDSPMSGGQVRKGIDERFMPTAPTT